MIMWEVEKRSMNFSNCMHSKTVWLDWVGHSQKSISKEPMNVKHKLGSVHTYAEIFSPTHTKTLNNEHTIASLTKHALRSVNNAWLPLENPSFSPSTRKRVASVFKILHSAERFWKDAFSVTVFTDYVWTLSQTGGKTLRFQTKTDPRTF